MNRGRKGGWDGGREGERMGGIEGGSRGGRERARGQECTRIREKEKENNHE